MMTNSIQSFVHDPYCTISNREIFLQDFLVILNGRFRISDEMFYRYFKNSKILSWLKRFDHMRVCAHRERVNSYCRGIIDWRGIIDGNVLITITCFQIDNHTTISPITFDSLQAYYIFTYYIFYVYFT